MYNNILFVLILFFLSLIYLKKFKSKQENFEQEIEGNDMTLPELGKDNEVYLYDFTENNLSIEENTKGELMKYYKFTSISPSKIIIKLKDIKDSFYISFYIKFNTPIKNGENRQTFVKFISGENKTNWSLFKFNNHVYGSINKDFHKFHSLINENTTKKETVPETVSETKKETDPETDSDDNKYHFVLITKKGNKVSFKLDEEIIEDLELEDPIGDSYIVFGGDNNNLLDEITQFDGNISNIQYKYAEPDVEAAEMSQCNFYPNGSSKINCRENCNSFNTLTCDGAICNNICNACKDSVSCPWTNDADKNINYIPGAPSPIRTTAGNKRVVLEWKKPFEGTNGTINSYIVIVKESYPSKDNTSNDEMIYNFDANDCENCQYEIKDLKNTVYYDISVKSQNTVHVGTEVKNNISASCSNIETIAPIGPINIKDYHSSLIESDEEIEMIYNNTLKEQVSCNQPQYNSGLTLDDLDMSKYDSEGLTARVLGTEPDEQNTLNNTYLETDKISDDIIQYLGNIE